MIRNLYVLLLIVLCQTFNLKAEVYDIDRMEDIMAVVDESTLVVFDLDNTIMQTKQALGSDQWFSAMLHRGMEEGKDIDAAVHEILPSYTKVHLVTEVEPVEAGTPGLIRRLQEQNIPVMGLTARSGPVIDLTFREIHSIGVDMSKSTPIKETFELELRLPAFLREGILFVGNNYKGDAMRSLITNLPQKPTKVVFVDDKLSHVESVERAVKEMGISCVGFRYGGADERVKSLDLQVADVQMRFLDGILSNEAARAIIESENSL
ncbi:MAG: phosphoglycolate phosphatase-like HAD superfamily hydrolase [Chlamydiales bacterium]|jgi:phosphoglycolate phosphatase-like HAD superfamily hydrolase